MNASYIKIASGIKVDLLVGNLLSNPHLWDQNPHRREYIGSPHSEMHDIWVRFGKGEFSLLSSPHVSEWYECIDLIPEAREISKLIMDLVEGEELGGVLITKLEPGKKINPHIDNGWHASYYEKFYVALRAPEGSFFGFESGNIVADDGDCYFFRNDRLHWVSNETKETRLTMIVCIKTNIFKGV